MTGRRTFSATGTDSRNIASQSGLAHRTHDAIVPSPPAEPSRVESSMGTLDHVILDEFLLVEDLEVLGGDEDVVAARQGQLQAAFAGELDVQRRAVEEDQVEADEAAEGRQAADPRRPGRAAVAPAVDVEVVRADVDRDRAV